MRKFNKVFVIGLSRSGTRSVTLALSKLGIEICHHLKSTIGTAKCLEGEVEKVPELEYYRGLSDLPAAMYYKRLDKMFPGSLFIYTLRSKEKWLKSCSRNYQRAQGPLFSKFYQSDIFDKDTFGRVYDKHKKKVFKYFRESENFLAMYMPVDFNWQILCSFLETDIPDCRFPNVKDSRVEEYSELKKLRKKITEEIDGR